MSDSDLYQENVIHQVLLLSEGHLQSVHLHKYGHTSDYDDSEWSPQRQKEEEGQHDGAFGDESQ